LNHTVQQAVAALQSGSLVILPTETVYGLGADAANPEAIARIYTAKGRPRFNPLIAHVTGRDMAMRIAEPPPLAVRLMDAFWPGPLSLVVPIGDRDAVCDLARAGLDTVALRAPAHPIALAVLAEFGRPVCAPSANRSGRPSPTLLSDALEETGVSAKVALDGGPCAVGLESSVVAVLGDKAYLLRPGGLERSAIEAVTGPLATGHGEAHRSPGRLALHYAPKAPVRLNVNTPRPGEAWLTFGVKVDALQAFNLSPQGDLNEAAAHLFAFLRAADRLNPKAIAVAPIPAEGLGEAINDRLRRAAGYVG